MDKKWKKVSDAATSDENWNPVKAGDEISGLYVDRKENVGPNSQMVYVIKKDDGTFISVWGKTVLDSNMARVSVGDEIKIVYTGAVKNKAGNREFKTFDVFVLEPEKSGVMQETSGAEEKSEDVAPSDIPF